MSVPYVCCTKSFEEHYAGHVGSGLPYYSGVSYQKGYGIGGIFRRLFRSALPFLIKGAKTVGKEALLTGSRIASDVLEGDNFKVATKKRTREASKTLTQKAVNKVQNLFGKGGYKRKRKAKKRVSSLKVRKVRGRDIFDP